MHNSTRTRTSIAILLAKSALLCCFLYFTVPAGQIWAQSRLQTIGGIVTDQFSKKPLPSVLITIHDTGQTTRSDSLGIFQFGEVAIGRHFLTCQAAGYELYSTDAFILSSARPVTLLLELKQKVNNLEEFTITGRPHTSRPVNPFAFVSARSFTVEETERLPASINDPGRMALAYPGVKQGRDESENKILIRGNSPFGLLWRLEGIDIPSPNHFAIPGSGGGGISAFSAQLLSRSDFFTGGMPAEYGNTISGAMDIRFREGDKESRQHRIKAGLVGLDLSTEGPIRKGYSSYLINYRYSTLGLLSQMGFYLVGERVINYFQDLSFNLVFHNRTGKSTTTFFGIGGFSHEHYQPVKQPSARVAGIADQWEDRYKPANMGAYGVTHTVSINDRSSVKYVLAFTGNLIRRAYDTLNLEDVRFRYSTELYRESRLAGTATYNYKISSQTRLRAGAIVNYIGFRFNKEGVPRDAISDIRRASSETTVSGKGTTQTLQGYASLVHELKKGLTFQGGVHFMQLSLNNTKSVEPRASVQYKFSGTKSIGFAYGMYSQILPMGAYFYTKTDTVNSIPVASRPNFDLKLPRSSHFILSYHHLTKGDWKITTEIYAQFLSRIPVENKEGSTYYMLNQSDGFPETPAVGRGRGKNKGIDLGIEKIFRNKYYVLMAVSLFEAKFKTLNGRCLNAAFHDKFSLATTAGKEFSFKNGAALQIGAKCLYNGGFPYTPLNEARSATARRYIPLENHDFASHAPHYFRIDGRVSYRINKKRISSILSVDIQNVSNRINITSVGYNPVSNSLEHRRSGSGLVPVLSYQVDF